MFTGSALHRFYLNRLDFEQEWSMEIQKQAMSLKKAEGVNLRYKTFPWYESILPGSG